MKNITVISCAEAICFMRDYVEGELPNEQKVLLLEHVNICADCQSNLAARQQVILVADMSACMLMPL